jgi:hypothetical protein
MRRERTIRGRKHDVDEGEETEAEKTLPRRDLLPLNPLSPHESQWPPKRSGEPATPVLASPQTLGLNFTGATLGETNAFPPDSMGAVGPTQFVVAVNNRMKVFDKTTGALGALNSSTNTFFESVKRHRHKRSTSSLRPLVWSLVHHNHQRLYPRIACCSR